MKIKFNKAREKNIPCAVTESNITLPNGDPFELGEASEVEVTQEITTGADAASIAGTKIKVPSVTYSGNVNVESAVYFQSLQHLKLFGPNLLSAGDTAVTLGFYSAGDGGGSTYKIYSSTPTAPNGMKAYTSTDYCTLILLKTGLYAELQVPKNGAISIRQLGGRSLEDGVMFDNNVIEARYRAYTNRRKDLATMFIPSGHWPFSDTHWRNGAWRCFAVRLIGQGAQTVIMPYKTSQTYVWKIGDYRLSTDKDSANISAIGSEVSNMAFACGAAELADFPSLQSLYGGDKRASYGPLVIDETWYSTFKNLHFRYIYGRAFRIGRVFESHFRNIKFKCCGGIHSNTVYAPMRFTGNHMGASAASAIWLNYLEFEDCIGPCISGHRNLVHTEFNCIQVGGSATTYDNASTQKNVTGAYDYGMAADYKWSIIDGDIDFGWTKYTPNIINTLVVRNLDNWAVRSVYADGVATEESKSYSCVSVIQNNTTARRVLLLGNVAIPSEMPIVYTKSYTSGGQVSTPTDTYTTMQINQLFPKDKIFHAGYASTSFFKYQVAHLQSNLIFAMNSCSYLRRTFSDCVSPQGLCVSSFLNSPIYFYAKAGKSYYARVHSSSLVINYNSGYSASGLRQMIGSSWQRKQNSNITSSGVKDSNGWYFAKIFTSTANGFVSITPSGQTIDYIYEI